MTNTIVIIIIVYFITVSPDLSDEFINQFSLTHFKVLYAKLFITVYHYQFCKLNAASNYRRFIVRKVYYIYI